MPVKALAAAVLSLVLGLSGVRADGVGFRDVRVETGGERMTVAVWYPTGLPSGRTVEGPFAMKAVRNAPLAGSRFGLVLISHGTGGGRLNHRGTAIRLAQAGYIAAAAEHSGDSWRDDRYSGTAANWVRRPRQLSVVLDRLLADPEFSPRIDPMRIAAIGHSAGGYSVLALIGGRADMTVLARHCTEFRDRDPVFCSYGRQSGPIGGRLPDLTDRRVRAAVAVAPVGTLFGPGAFAGVTTPAQIHRLGRDRVLRRPWHEDNIVRLMGGRARLVIHPKAHHFAFIAPFPAALIDEVGEPARDPPGFDRRAFLRRIDRQILAFLDTVLLAPRR
ncbi:MAG: hypothetical protein OXM58_11230 [Rhodospirillaceae bacterium]|nr:hypothetical protein [Rhodospirillaceae bacterium]MDE0618504.1 hypothetical protein [Rhodospirillaceae bacterium]